jgi:hypothetical protein
MVPLHLIHDTIAIQENLNGKVAEWMEKVSDDQLSRKADSADLSSTGSVQIDFNSFQLFQTQQFLCMPGRVSSDILVKRKPAEVIFIIVTEFVSHFFY